MEFHQLRPHSETPSSVDGFRSQNGLSAIVNAIAVEKQVVDEICEIVNGKILRVEKIRGMEEVTRWPHEESIGIYTGIAIQCIC